MITDDGDLSDVATFALSVTPVVDPIDVDEFDYDVVIDDDALRIVLTNGSIVDPDDGERNVSVSVLFENVTVIIEDETISGDFETTGTVDEIVDLLSNLTIDSVDGNVSISISVNASEMSSNVTVSLPELDEVTVVVIEALPWN